MRVTGGVLGGRKLQVPQESGLRPTSDRVREALGSALQTRDAFEGAQVLDLFAGSGALGLEALSRGASCVIAVDRSRRALQCVRNNALRLGLGERVRSVSVDLLKAPQRTAARLQALALEPYTLVFADPPYAHVAQAAELLEALVQAGLSERARVVLEHGSDRPPPAFRYLTSEASYRYGSTSIALLSPIPYKGET